MTVVTVCVGSSCHIKGARNVIKQFDELLKENHLEQKIELKGSFCTERCGKGLNWQIDDEPYSSKDVEEAVAVFTEKVIKPNLGDSGSGKADE